MLCMCFLIGTLGILVGLTEGLIPFIMGIHSRRRAENRVFRRQIKTSRNY
jgi:xanthosine utilization system XapX-like protein